MPHALLRMLFALLAPTLLPCILDAQDAPPDLTRGGAVDRHHDWRLGPTGARGWIWGKDLSTAPARQIAVTKVDPGSPADGVLQPGDVILGVGAAPFGSDARVAFGNAITAAEAGDGALLLLRWRSGQTATVTLHLAALGGYSDTAPFHCAKTAKIVDAACRHLLQVPLREDVQGFVNALGLLATGRPECVAKVKEFAHEAGAPDLVLALAPGMFAWQWGYACMFLSEYHLATGDDFVLPAIHEYATKMALGQSAVGTWGHGMSLPQNSGGLGGYGAINQAGLGCWLGLILAQQCGVDDAVVTQAVARSQRFFAFYTDKGSIPYGDHPPYWFLHDNNGKNAQAAVAFDLLGDIASTRFFARMSTAAYAEREFGHTGNYFSYLWGPLGVARLGADAVAAHLRQQRWFYDLARGWDGGFVYQGGAGADDSYEGWDTTGLFLLTWTLPQQQLRITGRGVHDENRLGGAELAAVIEDGRPFDPAHMHDSFVGMSQTDLLQRLGSGSPVVRYRAANALRRAGAAVVPQLCAMLGGADRNAGYGACQALELLGAAAAPAVDALIGQLDQGDEWLVIRAAFALAEIGKPARVAVPKLLQLLLAGTPDDPRQTRRRYLGLALFLANYVDNCPRRGLLADSFEDVDKSQLVRSIRELLQADDGMVRWHMGNALGKLDDAELELLWPDVLQAVRQPAPSGEMFANEIRLSSVQLLAKHHVEEGMAACVDYARHQEPWASENRMGPLMDALISYGAAAKPLLPQLRELLQYCRGEDFPDDCKARKVEAVQRAIDRIEAATERPELRKLGALAPGQLPRRDWQHHGAVWLLTDKDGADLPADAVVTDFPVLLRLARPGFDFTQAMTHGEDLRIDDAEGQPLHFQIDAWDAEAGTASIWVRVPRLVGDARQRLQLHWGRPGAPSASDGGAVFGAMNGYASVLHLDPSLQDATGTVQLSDQGTTAVAGRIGQARRLDGDSGLSGGDAITSFPSGAGDSSTEAWFRAERSNTTVLAWGKEQRPGKVMMNLRSPPHMAIQCYFADVEGTMPVAMGQWVQVVHTYRRGDSRVYVNGALDGASTPLLDIPKTVRLDIGGWHGHGFVGDVDEVRISTVARSPAWIRLQYENQKELQTLVGPIVAAGDSCTTSVPALAVKEGESATVTATAGGAQKIYWQLLQDGRATVVAVDSPQFTFAAGRVAGEQALALRLLAVYPQQTRTLDVPITVHEALPDPEFTLPAPARWDGRTPLSLAPQVGNLDALRQNGVDSLRGAWSLDGIAVVQHEQDGQLVLERAMGSGPLTIALALDNGGAPACRTVTIAVEEPARDAFVPAPVPADDLPEDHRFYSRDGEGKGRLRCHGVLAAAADEVFVRVLAEGRPFAEQRAPVAADRRYSLCVALQPGLVRYRAEFGVRTGERETLLRTADDLVCGDAYLIDGQSNAEATDVGDADPPLCSEWVRSFGCVSGDATTARTHVWGNACVRDRNRGALQVGYWGMVLGQRLVEAQQVPICILNGAVGGTRIDQHQRNAAMPDDVDSIYGRLLWRVRAAQLTHGIRAVLWHQGENDQGADGPSGRFGYETWRQDFVAMAAGWQRDYPNLQHIYVFQIWPKACAMGIDGSDDLLREVQRTLPRWFRHLSTMSTLGIDPPGGCHYPLAGWAEFARLIVPLIERDVYGVTPAGSITPPDLVRASFASPARDRIALDFDQPVVWEPRLSDQFHFASASDKVVAGAVQGNTLTLTLAAPTASPWLTYIDSRHWQPGNVLRGANGIAALTFCRVPIEAARAR